MAQKPAHYHKSEKYFPAWAVTLRKNWNLDDIPVQLGQKQIVRLFYTEIAAEQFADGINNLLREIVDVQE